jgi:RHS repeat-associated protein
MAAPENAGSVISLPTGGGAMKGLGEKFSPDPHTGTGNFTVPIAIPPGRNGFQPQLSVLYSTGNGNGLFGLGWTLNVPGVSRKTSSGVPRYVDHDQADVNPGRPDVFILSGAEDLAPVPEDNPAAVRYQPRTEGLFARITHHVDSAAKDDYWEVATKDGLVSFYGTPGRADDDPAVIANPRHPARAFSWKLTETSDPFRNRISYDYTTRDAGSGDGHDWDQPLLTQIRYADYGDPANPSYIVVVRFEYEDRPDPFSDYRAGFEMRTTKRCRAIVVATTDHNRAEHAVRRYSFGYDSSPGNGVSLLRQVEVIGFDDQGLPYDADDQDPNPRKKLLPPLTFGYSAFAPGSRRFDIVGGADLPASDLGAPELEPVDLHGSGLPDLIEMNGTVRYWRNRGDGNFDQPRPMQEAPPHSLADPGVQLIDANGDGRLDLLVTSGPIAGYYPLTHNPGWDKMSFCRYERPPSVPLDSPDVRLVDLTGDGYTDILRAGSRMECFFNDPDPAKAWRHPRFVPRRPLAEFPDVNFTDPRVRLADMTGDGMQDIVLLHDGNVEYWPSLGHGDWAPRISMRHAPRFPFGYDPRRILLGDVDGDGLADLIYLDAGRVLIWMNQSGNRWSQKPIEIHGTPPVTDLDNLRLIDLYGTGTAGVLWSTAAGGLARDRLMFLDLTAGRKPYLLEEMDNHTGALTRVSYKSSTFYYLQDQVRLKSRWRTTLPFPVQVVARVEAIDEVSGGTLTTEYRYHHGYWDGVEREFRGFGMVEQLDTETFNDHRHVQENGSLDPLVEPTLDPQFSPPTLLRTWFHQGPVGEEFGDWEELDYSAEYWSADPALLGHTARINEILRGYTDSRSLSTSAHRRRHARDALRALRGSVLRTELYGLDGPQAARPYTVTEHAYEVREESRAAPDGTDRSPIFFPHPVAQRTTQWERGDDPMTQFSFIGGYDDFGQPTEQTVVAMPRRADRRLTFTGAMGLVQPNEDRVLTTHTHTQYAAPQTDKYIHNRVAQSISYTFKVDATEDHRPPAPDLPGDDLSTILNRQWALAQQVRDTFATQPAADIQAFSHVVNHYDGKAFEGLRPGQLGAYGALVRVESLVLTDDIVKQAYGDATSDRRPHFLGGPAPSPQYPTDFGRQTGYRRVNANPPGYLDGWYVDSRRQRYDFHAGLSHPRGMVIGTKDALGNETTIAEYEYQLLPKRVTNAAGLETRAEYNYRTLQPVQVTDPNGSTTHTRFNPIGLPDKQFMRGLDAQGNETFGGSDAKPDIRYAYDFLCFTRTKNETGVGEPIHVHTSRRIDPASDNTIQSREFSDGFGRLVQTRTQAEEWVFGDPADQLGLPRQAGAARGPAIASRATDRVTVSGWQVFDNKRRVTEKYEPFFSQGWQFQREADAKRGQHVTISYDPRGNAIRTAYPDGSQQRVILGRPSDPTQVTVNKDELSGPAVPAGFQPTPWETYTYDGNDLAPLCAAPDGTSLASQAPTAHHFTPASAVVDAMARVICQVERNGHNPADWFVSRTGYDVRGNALTVFDAHGRDAFSYVYDLLNRPLRVDSRDAGIRTSVIDAQGKLIEYHDSKGSLTRRTYDVLGRLTQMWARDDYQGPFTQRERIIYGDEESATGARVRHALGRPVRHYDEAGLLETPEYDFKGNLLEKSRRTIKDSELPAWVADWSVPAAENALDQRRYTTSSRYDALNRLIEFTYPQDVAGGAGRTATPLYDRSGALVAVSVGGTTFVRHIAYNAKGQRVLIAYGNDLMTRQAYDPQTFRLARMRTERLSPPSFDGPLAGLPTATTTVTFTGVGAAVQDFTYGYDVAGNVVQIDERVANCGIANSVEGRDRLLREFSYDPTYRLIAATGRARHGVGIPRGLGDDPRCGFASTSAANVTQANAPNLTERYTERFDYDPAGNMLELSYHTGGIVDWKRIFGLADLPDDQWAQAQNNRLTSLHEGGRQHSYRFDDSGNLVHQNTERHYSWDHADRMTGYRVQPSTTSPPSLEARYLYGADGTRVKKWTRNQQGQVNTTVYVDRIFEHHRQVDATGIRETNTLHVTDNASRLALIRVGAPLDGRDASPTVQYHLGDHLGSSHVVVGGGDAAANTLVNLEEYFAFGETSFGSFSRKRYRYSGKERDEETGFYYFGTRYLAPGLARWVSADPAGGIEETNLYAMCLQNPLRFTDLQGEAPLDYARSVAEEHERSFENGAEYHYNNGNYVGMGFGLLNGALWTVVKNMIPTEEDMFVGACLPPAAAGLSLARGASESAIARGVSRWGKGASRKMLTIFHGTSPLGKRSIEEIGFKVAHNADMLENLDFGVGTYFSTNADVALSAAMRKVRSGKEGSIPVIMQFDIPEDLLGKLVDIRPGGKHGDLWQSFLQEETFIKSDIFKGLTNEQVGARLSGNRPAIFEEFLRRNGLTDWDTILGPLGDAFTNGAVSANGVSDQLVIRSQEVADRLSNIVQGNTK